MMRGVTRYWGCMLGKGEWAVRRERPNLFLPKISLQKKNSPKIFQKYIFAKNIFEKNNCTKNSSPNISFEKNISKNTFA